jgi:hypothetical protein
VPANHPGALADVGSVHDRHSVTVHHENGAVVVELVDVEESSPLCGLRKRVLLEDGSAALVVGYELPSQTPEVTVETCLSPDYLRLLRNGTDGLHRWASATTRGASNGEVSSVWVAVAPNEGTTWADPGRHDPGHGVLVRLVAGSHRFHLLLGVGDIDDETAELAIHLRCERLAGTTGSLPMGAHG